MNAQLAVKAQVPAAFVNKVVTGAPPPPPHLAAVREGVEMHEAFLQVSCAPRPWAATSYCTAAELEGLRMGLLCGGFRVPSRAQRQAPLRREETRVSGSVLACPCSSPSEAAGSTDTAVSPLESCPHPHGKSPSFSLAGHRGRSCSRCHLRDVDCSDQHLA